MANAATLKPIKPQISTAAAGPPALASACTFAMLSHRGRLRHTNEDACAALPEHGAFVLCDGMGGAAGGEVASHLATEAFLNSLSHPAAHRVPPKTDSSPTNPNCPPLETYPPNHPHTRLHQAVSAANHAVFQRAQKSRSLQGMGTTLVALLWEAVGASRNLWLAHVGDSRCYLLRRGALQLLTRDHSLVEEQVRAGLLHPAQAAVSPLRNIITRAIGSQPAVEPEIATHATQPGDLYLLASDGLTRELDDTKIARILTQSLTPAAAPATLHPAALEPAAKALIDAANQHGGRDNITVLLVACP
jgi:protein phosphatase